MSGALALQARGLRKAYRGVVAVESLDPEVEPGTVLGFLGPNGAGKTTVIRMLSTVLRPDAGWFAVAGVPQDQPVEICQRVGVLPESAGHPPGQTGEEWVSFHAELFGRPRDDARATARRLLAEVGLAERGGSLISGYSRGMRPRLGIARALINDPQVMFHAGLVEPDVAPDRYQFGHALIRHAVYADLNPSRQVRLHRRLATALEAARAASLARIAPGEVAAQYQRSAVLAGAEAGVAPTLEAAEQAQAASAYGEAASFLAMACELAPPGDTRLPGSGLGSGWRSPGRCA